MTNPPQVSICVPTYNGREHLAECIKNICAQTFRDFEVVICDDQSSDGTLELARQLADGDSRFRFISNPCRFGLVGNWNNCVKLSRGEWIKFVFQDDVIKPSCLEKLLAACQCENMPFGFCERDFIFEEGTSEDMRNWFVAHKQRLESDYQCSSVINPEQVAQIMVREPWHNLVGEPTVTLIKKLVFQELGGFDEGLVQLCDAEFWCRILINYGAAFVPESLAVFRIHAKAVTISNHQKRAYRMEVLDSLLLRYRFAFGRHFKALRNSRLTGKSTLSLRKECAIAAAQAWQQARRIDESNEISLIKEWRTLKLYCPCLQTAAYLGCGLEFMRRIKHGFSKHLVF